MFQLQVFVFDLWGSFRLGWRMCIKHTKNNWDFRSDLVCSLHLCHIYRNNTLAILDFGFSGEQQGNAVVNVLFGVANPAGKMPHTMPNYWNETKYGFRQYPGIPATAKDACTTIPQYDPCEPTKAYYDEKVSSWVLPGAQLFLGDSGSLCATQLPDGYLYRRGILISNVGSCSISSLLDEGLW